MSLLTTRLTQLLQAPGPFSESLISCRKTDRFCVNLQTHIVTECCSSCNKRLRMFFFVLKHPITFNKCDNDAKKEVLLKKIIPHLVLRLTYLCTMTKIWWTWKKLNFCRSKNASVGCVCDMRGVAGSMTSWQLKLCCINIDDNSD